MVKCIYLCLLQLTDSNISNLFRGFRSIDGQPYFDSKLNQLIWVKEAV
jgi:hypothetical protein